MVAAQSAPNKAAQQTPGLWSALSPLSPVPRDPLAITFLKGFLDKFVQGENTFGKWLGSLARHKQSAEARLHFSFVPLFIVCRFYYDRISLPNFHMPSVFKDNFLASVYNSNRTIICCLHLLYNVLFAYLIYVSIKLKQ